MYRDHENKLSKSTISIISFLCGTGVLSIGTILGLGLPPAAHFLLCHAKAVLQVSFVGSIVLFVHVLGKPVSHLLSKGGR